MTRDNGDAPIKVTCGGGTYWAIAPNVPHDAQSASGGMQTGFATFWDGESLAPNGGYYYKPLALKANRQPIQEGDLVFQVPLTNGEAKIVGLAVIDMPTRTVSGLAKFADWGQQLLPSMF